MVEKIRRLKVPDKLMPLAVGLTAAAIITGAITTFMLALPVLLYGLSHLILSPLKQWWSFWLG